MTESTKECLIMVTAVALIFLAAIAWGAFASYHNNLKQRACHERMVEGDYSATDIKVVCNSL